MRFFLSDQVDSVKLVTDESGKVVSRFEYYPYGESFVEENYQEEEAIAPKFGSQELDKESGYYYFNARHYNPEISRFVSADPVIDGVEDTQGWNRYSYVKGNPVVYKDPTGLSGDSEYEETMYGDGPFSAPGFDSETNAKKENYQNTCRVGDNGNEKTADAVKENINKKSGYDKFWDRYNGKYKGEGVTGWIKNVADDTVKKIKKDPEGTIGDILGAVLKKKGLGKVIKKAIGKGKKGVGKKVISEKLSKVKKAVTKQKIGKFEKTTEVRPGKGPGQSRAEYVRIKNEEGKVIRTYKDSYDRSNKFQGRKPLRGGPEGRPQE